MARRSSVATVPYARSVPSPDSSDPAPLERGLGAGAALTGGGSHARAWEPVVGWAAAHHPTHDHRRSKVGSRPPYGLRPLTHTQSSPTPRMKALLHKTTGFATLF